MKRRLLFGERMLLGEGKEPFNVVIPFRLRGVFEEKEIEDALGRLQKKHPWLRALVRLDEKNVPWFEVSKQTNPVPIRIVEQKSEEDWRQEAMQELHTLFDYKNKPLIRWVWIKGNDSSDMLLVFHHCLCDGGSAMNLLYEFLKVLDDPTADIGIENPILGIQDVVPAPILKNKKQRFKAKMVGRLATLAIKCIPVSRKAIDRQTDYLIHWKLDQTTSQELISHCKSLDITVNTFLSATVLDTFKKVRRNKAFNKVSCPVDIRRFAPQIKEDHIFAFGLMIVVSSNPKLGFLNNLRLMQHDVDRKTAKLNPYITMMVMESAHSALNNFTKLLKRGKSSNDCMFSNLGRIQIPHQYQSFALETIFSPSVLGPLGNTTTMITSTYQGVMDFTFMGSEGYLPYNEALAIRDEIIDSIKRRLNYQAAS
ncbi:condensation domain-containing protein [Flavobacterium poyangense]|uniref:condensation domain-containing protein n=1 Tax=Flavobacterium poyangense TaxID=2204302 RepID=UPI001422C1C4|nr:condensation domain-containing protein [Flavobacterium sp. JXAS1]